MEILRVSNVFFCHQMAMYSIVKRADCLASHSPVLNSLDRSPSALCIEQAMVKQIVISICLHACDAVSINILLSALTLFARHFDSKFQGSNSSSEFYTTGQSTFDPRHCCQTTFATLKLQPIFLKNNLNNYETRKWKPYPFPLLLKFILNG